MAVKARSPWWLSAIFAAGLVLLFIGERAFDHVDWLRLVCTGVGAALVGGTTALRGWVLARAEGRQRKVELISLLCHGGVLVALFGYFLTTTTGVEMLGIEEAESQETFRTAATVLWTIAMTVSLVPLLLIELVLGAANRTSLRAEGEANASVDLFRVREMGAAGLTIALAAAFLMVTCNVADQRNIRKDVSYFKTSSPGTATINMVESMTEPLTVLLFFPEVNEVADEVEAYFTTLHNHTGNVVVRRVDRLVDGVLAKEYRVARDGTIVLLRGELPPLADEDEDEDEETKAPKADEAKPKSEKIMVSADIKEARRTELREFDSKVQKAVMQVIREPKVAYFSVGHGELNDPRSAGPFATPNPLAKSTLIKQGLRQINYRVKDWDGFGKPVPDDADVLFVLAPQKPLLPEELRAIDDFLARGGRLLFALDPKGEATLGQLEGRLGLKFDPTELADDREFMVRTRTVSDHRLILTNQFSAHAAVTTLSRGQARSGILFVGAGSVEDAPFTVKAGDADPKRTYVIRSMATAFRDLDGDFTYDSGAEKKSRYNLMAAIEDPAAVPEKLEEGKKHEGMRAIVVTDAEIFSDAMLLQIPIVQALVLDAVKWLGGEEEFVGKTENEKDVLIEHTKNEDAIWFYSTVVGAPILVLAIGLAVVTLRRRRSSRRSS